MEAEASQSSLLYILNNIFLFAPDAQQNTPDQVSETPVVSDVQMDAPSLSDMETSQQKSSQQQAEEEPAELQTEAANREEFHQSDQSQTIKDCADLSAEDKRVSDHSPDATCLNKRRPSSDLCQPSESSQPVKAEEDESGEFNGGLETSETESFIKDDNNIVLPMTESQQEVVQLKQEVEVSNSQDS